MNKKPLAILSATFATLLLQGCLEDNSYIYDTPPQFPPVAIIFEDTSLSEGIGGPIQVTRAVDESSFSAYIIRWGTGLVAAGNEQGIMEDGNLNFIAKITKDQPDIVHYLAPNTPIPPGVDSIVVSAHNALGESTLVAAEIINLVENPRTPETRASGFSATDSEPTARITADLAFTPALDQEDIEKYYIRYAGQDGCPLAGEPISSYPASDLPQISDFVEMGLPPNSATNLLIVSGGEFGEHAEDDCANYIAAPEGTWNDINYNLPATEKPSDVIVTDVDPGLAIDLEIHVAPAQYELDIRHYAVYLGEEENCTFIGNLPKGGGTIHHQLTFAEYNESIPHPNFSFYTIYPNRTVTVVSDGESCDQLSRLGKTYTENSGNWHLIHHVNGTETTEINNHYDSIQFEYHPDIFNDWDPQCVQVNGTDLEVADCNQGDGRQRFTVVSLEDPENSNLYTIQSLYNQNCFQRSADDGEHDWFLAPCDGGIGQSMEITPDATDANHRKITAYRITSITDQSCATASSGRNDVYGTWNNCDATSDIQWQFWPKARPSDRNQL